MTRKSKYSCTLILLTALVSCQNKSVAPTIAVTADTAVQPKPKKKFQDVKFDNTKDLVCTMPITAGITDTMHYNGKTFGFCSAGCKEEFVKSPEKYLSQ